MDKDQPKRIFDNTRLSAFKRCPRYFYYRHRRHWVPEGTSAVALVFGSSWHKAMDALWTIYSTDRQNLTVEAAVACAFEAFEQRWTEEGLPSQDELEETGLFSMKLNQMDKAQADLRVRNLMTAKEMIWEYTEKRQSMFLDKSLKLVQVEQPFAVPLTPDDPSLIYVGRIDKVVEYKGQTLGIEHKTSSAYKAGGPFRATFVDSFSPDAQIDGYLYAGHMLYGDAFRSIWVDAALVHKDVHDGFLFIPVERQFNQLDSWLWETRQWINLVELNDQAAPASADKQYMAAWPKNTNSCWDFFRACPYLPLCKMWANPTDKELPAGYKEEKWEPFNELKLEQIGLGKG